MSNAEKPVQFTRPVNLQVEKATQKKKTVRNRLLRFEPLEDRVAVSSSAAASLIGFW